MLGRAMISGLLVGRNGGRPIGRRALTRLQQPNERDDHGRSREDRRAALLAVCAGGAAAAALGIYMFRQRRIAFADANVVLERPKRPDLPTLSLKEISQHNRDHARKWVTFKQGVYDITDFIGSHPGGDKILLAAGGSLEPFWSLYAQHKSTQVLEILEELRIGNLDEKDMQETAGSVDANDPYSADPRRHPALIVNSEKPYNAETPPSLLADSFVTPIELFFVRNHLPVPQVADLSKHQLRVEVQNGKKKGAVTLNVDD
uniref:Cytochrome b5 heme-binding domain-containing protein n=1 Tax=Plectus sambesii TaxID=2011161 RepID=A0A914UQE0_9BILA